MGGREEVERDVGGEDGVWEGGLEEGGEAGLEDAEGCGGSALSWGLEGEEKGEKKGGGVVREAEEGRTRRWGPLIGDYLPSSPPPLTETGYIETTYSCRA